MTILLGAIALALLIGTLLSAGVAGAALRRAIRFAMLASRPQRSIADLGDGPCRIRGFINVAREHRSRPPLDSPISHRPCVFYELSLKHEGSEYFSEKQSIPSALSDGTSEADIDVASSELQIRSDRAWSGGVGREIPPGLDERTFQRISKAVADIRQRKNLGEAPLFVRLEERAIFVGQTLFVTGIAANAGGFMSGKPIIASDREFGEIAKTDGFVAVMCVGLALLLDMRLLGRFAGIPYPALQRFLSLAWLGFGINFVSGSCLFAAQATSYITDVVYMSKMALVVLGAITAAILQNHVNHDSAKWDVATPPVAVRSIAVVSMVFWVSAIILGRLTAYLDITFSQLFGIS